MQCQAFCKGASFPSVILPELADAAAPRTAQLMPRPWACYAQARGH